MAKKINVDYDFTGSEITGLSSATDNSSPVIKSDFDTAVAGKQDTLSAQNAIQIDNAVLSLLLSTASEAEDNLTLSGMSDNQHNVSYQIVENGGSKVKLNIDISGSNVHFDMETEAQRKLTLSGMTNSALNGIEMTVLKYTGSIDTSDDLTWTWSTGSTSEGFNVYYWNSANQIFVCWDDTNNEFKAFNLTNTSGANSTSFIADLDSTGSTAGYISGGESFTLDATTDGEAIVSTSETYPDEIYKIPDSTDAKVTYGSAESWPYYCYQHSTSPYQYIAYSHKSGYWTAFRLDSDLDLRTTTPTDDQSFTQPLNDWEYITASSDDYGDGVNIPDADASEVTYGTPANDSYLGQDSNGLYVQVEDTVAGTSGKVPSSAAVQTALSGKEDTITAGTTSQYYRGDKTFQTLDKTAVGLANVDNTSDADKPVSTAQQTALDLKADDSAVLKKDGSVDLTADWDIQSGGFHILSSTPTLNAHLVNKEYVDAATSGAGAFWAPVDLEADSNITLSGEQTIDGVLTSSSRVLCSGQTDASENGIYVTAAGAWSRATDADADGEFKQNKTVAISLGDTKSGSVWAYTGSDDPVVGTDDLTFTKKQDSAQIADGSINTAKLADSAVTTAKLLDDAVTAAKINADVAGAGLGTDGSGALTINVDDSTVEISGDTLQVKDDGIGSTQLADLAVATASLQDDSVTSAKIGADQVLAEHLGADVAGDGLSQAAGGALDVNVDDSTIEVDTDALRLKDAGVTFAKMASAAISSDIQNDASASKLARADAVKTYVDSKTASHRYEENSISLTADTAYTINHALDELYCVVACYDSSNDQIDIEVSLTDADNLTITSTSTQTGVTCVVLK